jgi:ribosomal protein S15P/S13E
MDDFFNRIINDSNRRSYLEENYIKKDKYLAERIDKLNKNGNFFESMLWFSQVFEAKIAKLLSLCEESIKLTGEIHNILLKNYKPHTYKDIIKSKKTLGKLKDELCPYLKDKDEILILLEKFIDDRNKIIHHFFKEEDLDPEILIKKYESEIKDKILCWWKLWVLLDEQINKLNEQIKKLREHSFRIKLSEKNK